MKRLSGLLIVALCLSGALQAQDQQPFVFSFTGGLFFPSHESFSDVYHVNSDIIWSAGVNLPATSTLFVTADIGYFSTEGFPQINADTSAKLEERFIHAGLLTKQQLSGLLFARLMAGFNYVRVRQTVSGSHSAPATIEAENKIGYYGGAGLEEFIPETHFSVFGDVIYDYRRSHQREVYGDYGGLRLVLGVNVILF
jgi:hypothetical protein